MLKNMTTEKQQLQNEIIDLKYKNKLIKTVRIEDYNGYHEPIKHICCGCNGEWVVSPAGVINGGNCRKCKIKTQTGTSSITHEIYLEELISLGIDTFPIDSFINKSTKINHECADCKQIWHTSPKALLKSRYGVCPSCSKLRQNKASTKTNKEYIKQLNKLDNGVTAIEKYDHKNNFLHKCSCGNIWKSSAGNILRGHKCTNWRNSGQYWNGDFYKNKKTILYYIKVGNLFKIGVTLFKESIEKSIFKIRFASDIKNGVLIELIYTQVFEDGSQAFDLEQSILVEHTDCRYNGNNILGGGNSELFNVDINPKLSFYSV